MLPCYRAYDAVMRALAQAVPDRAIAAGFDNALITCLARLADAVVIGSRIVEEIESAPAAEAATRAGALLSRFKAAIEAARIREAVR